MMTRPLMTRGAWVMVLAFVLSTVFTLHTGLPVLAFRAISRPSKAPRKIFPFQAATPRLTTSQQPLTLSSRGTCGSYDHNNLPVLASYALTMLHAVEKYITPSITIGVASCPRFVSKSPYHARPSLAAFSPVIFASGLKRCSL